MTNDIIKLAETYRARLGLLPWHEQRDRHAIVRQGRLRRGGKTTQAILESIAYTVAHPGEIAAIITPPSEVKSVRKRVRELGEQIGVDVSRVRVCSYRDAVEGRGGNYRSPTTLRTFDDLDAPHAPEQRMWIERAYDAGLAPPSRP